MSVTITLIQPNLIWEDKKANLDQFSEKIENIKEKTQVVILPEMFSTGFSMNVKLLGEKMNGESVHWMRVTAQSKKIIVAGSLIIEEDGKYYNRLIWMLPDGRYGYYDKRHLFAYAKEDRHFTAGGKRLIASVNGWKINLMICYDLRFPVWSRQMPQGVISSLIREDPAVQLPEKKGLEYDCLIFVANWPEKRNTAWQALLIARAIENQCYVIGVNRVGKDGNGICYSGNSMVIDPLGTILYQKEAEEDVFTCILQKEILHRVRQNFPFWKDADEFHL